MDLERKDVIINADVAQKPEEDSSFDKLLNLLISFGVDEEVGAEMIANCISEQYQIDQIRDEIRADYLSNNLEKTLIH